MIDGGYLAKTIEKRPEYIRSVAVREICSVSCCISAPPEDWIDKWLHNEFGWFNTVEDAWAVVPNSERARFRLFAYRIAPTRYRKGREYEVLIPADVQPAPIPSDFTHLGFDAANKSMESVLGFECSPLSCNAMADEIETNEFCLVDSAAAGLAIARSFSIDEPEPGDYFMIEVLARNVG